MHSAEIIFIMRWSIPVSSDEIDEARKARWSIYLISNILKRADWNIDIELDLQ